MTDKQPNDKVLTPGEAICPKGRTRTESTFPTYRKLETAAVLARFFDQIAPEGEGWNYIGNFSFEVSTELRDAFPPALQEKYETLSTNLQVIGGEVSLYDPNDQYIPVSFFKQLVEVEASAENLGGSSADHFSQIEQ